MSVTSIVASGRRLIATTFLDSGLVQDRALVPDGSGGTKQSWTSRSSPILCRFVALKDDLPVVEGNTMFGIPTAMWLAPLGTSVDQGDQVINQIDGSTWIFTTDITPPSNLAVCVRMGIREVGA